MTSTLTARQARIAQLAEHADHAQELLSALDELLGAQERVVDRLDASSIRAASFPAIDFSNLVEVFDQFIDDVNPSLPLLLQTEAERVVMQRPVWPRWLASVAKQDRLATIADELECGEAAATFFAYGFLQPVARVFTESRSDHTATGTRRRCPYCEWRPIAAILRDTPEIKGERLLVCALCDTEWPYVRVACANCGESTADALVVHESETHKHIRLDECKNCQAYLKTIDLRRDGRADALVDDVASVELDLWAAGQQLVKIQRNVFGL